MKKPLTILLLVGTVKLIALTGCASYDSIMTEQEQPIYSAMLQNLLMNGSGNQSNITPAIEVSWNPASTAISEFTTDVVIVRHINSRPFRETLTEHEFVVLERVLGNAPDRIFVYTTRPLDLEFPSPPVHSNHIGFAFPFNPETNYLLPLIRIGNPYAKTHEDGYTMVNYIVIDLDNPSNSAELGRPLSSINLGQTGLNFEANPSMEQIIQFISELTEGNPTGREYIRSDMLEDIIKDSPYVFVVEINRPLRLVHEQVTRDWGETDLFYATVVQALKGDIEVGAEIVVTFFACTVQRGERHIVAVEPLSTGSTWFRFTSRNSLFSLEQLGEITQALQ